MLFSRARPPALVRLDPAHAEACATLHAGSFAHGWSALDFERLIAAPSSFGDAALDRRSGAPAGFVLSRGAAGEAEILTIVVAPAWRGRGLGRSLIAHHVDRLATARIETLFLEVNEDNAPARRLYEREGFTQVGRRENYYAAAPGRQPAAALVLRRPIG